MANIQEQIGQAKSAGYDDATIIQHLNSMPEYSPKIKTALDAGYKPTEIIGFLAPDIQQRQNVESEGTPPAWAKEHPELYKTAVKTRNVLGPAVEMLGGMGGGIIGAGAGTVASPTLIINPATGAAVGAGLGYGAVKEGLNAADVYLGLKKPRQGAEIITEPVQNVIEGASYEAGGRAVPVVLGNVVKGATNVVGKVMDLRQIPAQKAAKIARESIAGGELDTVINALRNSAPGTTPAQAMVEAGINQPTAQALLKRAAERDPKFFSDLLKTEDFQTVNALAKIAGGESQTAARTAQATSKNALNESLIPTLETEMNAANTAGKLKPALENKAQTLADLASAKVEDVRRMTAASGRAGDMARAQMIERNLPVGAARYTYMGELSKRADDVATQAAAGSLPVGEASRFSQAAADSLAAHGLTPLKTESVVKQLNAKLADPKIGPNKDVANTIKQVITDLNDWTNAGGVIDAWALDTIRKSSVNAAINKLVMDPAQQKQLAAKVMVEIKPLLIDAVEKAGGTNYGKYLTDYAAGMQKIGQTKLGAKALDLYKSSPKQFVDLVEGNSPEVVEKLFGPGSYDIAKEMSQDAMKTFGTAAKQVNTRAEIGKQASEGEKALVDLMKDNISTLKLPNVFSVAATTTNKALDILERKVGKATLAKLTEGSKTAESFDKLLNTLPATERNAVLKTLRDPDLWAPKEGLPYGGASLAIKNMMEFDANQNALAPNSKNKNALAK